MKTVFFIFLFLLTIQHSMTQSVLEVKLWENGSPNSNGIIAEESINKRTNGYQNVTKAAISVYLPEKTNPTSAVILCPGGGYITVNTEQCHNFAKWLVSKGMAAIVLKYRLPNGHPEVPVSDAIETFRIIHENANKWNIEKTKIGIAGFSAGGHLASYLATHCHDSISKPVFAMQFFSVINANANYAHMPSVHNLLGKNPTKERLDEYSNDLHVNPLTPPTIIFCPSNDPIVNSQNSIEYCLKLKKHNVPVTMYLFPDNSHGQIMENRNPYSAVMKELLEKWLINEKLI
jgi:acetyl esterase/lipase